jgi:hypothetical protein
MKKLLLSLFLCPLFLNATTVVIGTGSGSFSQTSTLASGDTLGITAGNYTGGCTISNQSNITIIPYGGNVTFSGGGGINLTSNTNITFTNMGAYTFQFNSITGDAFYINNAQTGIFINHAQASNIGGFFMNASSSASPYVYYNGTKGSLLLYNIGISNCKFTGCGVIFQGDYTSPTNLRNFVDSMTFAYDTMINVQNAGEAVAGNITRLSFHNNLEYNTSLNTNSGDVGYAYINGWGYFYDNTMYNCRGYLVRDFLYSLSSNVGTTLIYNNIKHDTYAYGLVDIRNDSTSYGTYCTKGNFQIFNNTVLNNTDTDYIAPLVVVYQMDAGATGIVYNNFGANLTFTTGGTFITSFSNGGKAWVEDTSNNIYTQSAPLTYLQDTTTTFMPTSTSYLNNNGIAAPLSIPDLYGFTPSGNRIGAIGYNPGGTPPSFGAGTNTTITLPLDSLRTGNVATAGTCPTLTYSWSQQSGPNTATILTPTADSSWFKNLIAGTYIFRLTVTDNCSLSSYVQDTIKVNAAPAQPCNCVVKGKGKTLVYKNLSGPSYDFDDYGEEFTDTLPRCVKPNLTVSAKQTVTLNTVKVVCSAVANGNNGHGIQSFQWTQYSGQTATLTNANTANVTASFTATGPIVLQCETMDSCGAFSTALDSIVVNPNPTPSGIITIVQAKNGVVPGGSNITITFTGNTNGTGVFSTTDNPHLSWYPILSKSVSLTSGKAGSATFATGQWGTGNYIAKVVIGGVTYSQTFSIKW